MNNEEVFRKSGCGRRDTFSFYQECNGEASFEVTGKYANSYNKLTRVLGDTKAAFDKQLSVING